MAVDISRQTEGVVLPEALASEIWQNAQEASAVMRLGRQVPLPGSGKTIPIITGDAVADWVAETDEKPLSRATLGSRSMTPYKLSVIEPFSDEFRRDLPAVYRELARRLPNAIAVKFDDAVFNGPPPGSNFDTLESVEEIAIGPAAGDVTQGTWAGLVEADATVAEAEGTLNGWVFSPAGRALLLSQVDNTGRPLVVPDVSSGQLPNLLGVPFVSTRRNIGDGAIGLAGDWDAAFWGTVEGISIAISDTASLTDGTTEVEVGGSSIDIPKVLNLWQRNMFAIRVEVEVGFIVRDHARFVRLTGDARGDAGNP